MAEKILMIALSPTMDEGSIVSWSKKEGEKVSVGDILCVVETDKAAMDYESQAEGVLLKILVPGGGQAKVADPIAIVGSPGEDISSLLSASPGAERPTPASPPPAVASASQQPQAQVAPEAPPAGGHVRSSPLARKLAAARGIDIARTAGSGPGGRVIKRDVEAASAPGAAEPLRAQGQASLSPADQTLPVTAKRKLIAQRLSESAFHAPHFYLTVSIAMDGLLAARARLNRSRDGKVSFNAFLHKLAALALCRHPEVNASWQGESIKRFGSVDIGLAVALPDGLITPVVRGCDRKGVLAIDTELGELVKKAHAAKLQPDEYTGATFTISNLGSFGIEAFTAIINPPASAILAVGMVQKVPVVGDGDAIVVRSMMKATLSCDHRVIDGATGAVFLRDLKEMIENPYAVLL